jgi:hypothetical protein
MDGDVGHSTSRCSPWLCMILGLSFAVAHRQSSAPTVMIYSQQRRLYPLPSCLLILMVHTGKEDGLVLGDQAQIESPGWPATA